MSDLLYQIASDLITVVEQVLEDGGLRPPGRRFVDVGTGVTAPVEFGDDCVSQLTVQVAPLNPSFLSNEVQRRSGRPSCALVWSARFTIVMLRCHPMWAELPSPDEIDAEARDALTEGWQITRGMSRKWHDGDLVPSYSFDCENTAFSAVTPLAPQGGIRGWTMPLDVTVHERYVPIDPQA